MDEQIHLEIKSITRSEYIQAGSESVRRLILPALAVVIVLTIIIGMVIADFSLKSILPPIVIVLAFLLLLEFMVIFSWRKYPADTAFSYDIDKKGWVLHLGDEDAQVDWRDTERMVVRRRVILLYNEGNRSNLIPRSSVTDGQLSQLRTWFAGSRAQFKVRKKEKDDQFRAEQRNKRVEANSRLDRRRRRR